jgi:hypothetical protein
MIRLTCEKEPDDTQSRRGDYTEGFAKRKDGKRSQESGDRRQESGVRNQEEKKLFARWLGSPDS